MLLTYPWDEPSYSYSWSVAKVTIHNLHVKSSSESSRDISDFADNFVIDR